MKLKRLKVMSDFLILEKTRKFHLKTSAFRPRIAKSIPKIRAGRAKLNKSIARVSGKSKPDTIM